MFLAEAEQLRPKNWVRQSSASFQKEASGSRRDTLSDRQFIANHSERSAGPGEVVGSAGTGWAPESTLAVARKLVAYLVAVDHSQRDFLVAENQNRTAA